MNTLADVVLSGLGGVERARPWDPLHASDLSRDVEFCPREVALTDHLGVRRRGASVPALLRITFDEGRDRQARLNNHYLRDVMVGHWYCPACGEERLWSSAPVGPCREGHHLAAWVYREPVFTHAATRVVCSPDGLCRLGGALLTVMETKIMANDEWVGLKAPLAEHRLRTQLYLRIIAEAAESGWAEQVDTRRARLLYWLRGYGRKVEEAGEVTPFKEYVVERDDGAVEYLLTRAMVVHRFRLRGTAPRGICPTVDCGRAGKCQVARQCFSGQYRPGVKL